MALMGPHGLNPVFDQRPLVLLDRDFDGSPTGGTYDTYDHFFREHPLMSDGVVPPLSKCNQRACRVRTEGNRFFQPLDFVAALGKYNESICYAKEDSEDLGISYANRSAVYYEMGEYEHALVNIRLAKKHNYPERLMAKLKERELNCQLKLSAGQSKGVGDPCPRMNINVVTNPKIPSLAKGIRMEVLPNLGRSMMANLNFKTSDIILDEKSILAVVDAERRYHQCGHCGTGNEKLFAMKPCPNCVSVMYCSEECLERDWKYIHRFECAVSDKLQYVSYSHVAMGSKLFLYGLTLFEDNLDAMMRYFETLEKSGGNALNLDYTQYDPMEEFKDLCNVKPDACYNDSFARMGAAAHCFMLLKNSAVATIVNTADKRTFMFKCVGEFVQLAKFYKWEGYNSPLCPVASLFNHSCDPNAVATIHSGQVRIVVLRPIRKGEQICVSYGSLWWDEPHRKPYIGRFVCKCVVCDPKAYANWRGQDKRPPPRFYKDLEKACQVFGSDQVNNATMSNALTQFIERYAYLHPLKELAVLLNQYQITLRTLAVDGDGSIHRAKAQAELETADD